MNAGETSRRRVSAGRIGGHEKSPAELSDSAGDGIYYSSKRILQETMWVTADLVQQRFADRLEFLIGDVDFLLQECHDRAVRFLDVGERRLDIERV